MAQTVPQNMAQIKQRLWQLAKAPVLVNRRYDRAGA
jgi:hypothetical protein